jgi:hypothetical protein
MSVTSNGSDAAASRTEISASSSARLLASFSASYSLALSMAWAHWLPSAITKLRTLGSIGRAPSNRNVSAPSTRSSAIRGTVALVEPPGSPSVG